MRTFKNVIEPCADQARKSGDSDDEKTFVLFASRRNALELQSAAVEIGLQNIGRDKHGSGDHQPKGRDGHRSEMEERNHVSMRRKGRREYTRGRARPRQKRASGRGTIRIEAAPSPVFL